MIRVIHLRGTDEPDGPGVSDAFLSALDPARFKVIRVSYPADYGRNVHFLQSSMAGRWGAIDTITADPSPFILSGYSQGALVAGDLAEDIVLQEPGIHINPARLAGVVLIADPKRPAGAGAPGLPTPPGYGIAGQRPIEHPRVFWGTAPRDGIAALPADNPLRTVADLTEAFTYSPQGWDEWAREMYNRLILRRDLQLWFRFGFRPARWAEAATALHGYLLGGEHTTRYLERRIPQRLAELVNREIR